MFQCGLRLLIFMTTFAYLSAGLVDFAPIFVVNGKSLFPFVLLAAFQDWILLTIGSECFLFTSVPVLLSCTVFLCLQHGSDQVALPVPVVFVVFAMPRAFVSLQGYGIIFTDTILGVTSTLWSCLPTCCFVTVVAVFG